MYPSAYHTDADDVLPYLRMSGRPLLVITQGASLMRSLHCALQLYLGQCCKPPESQASTLLSGDL